ncbi:MAG: hypothetical protein GC150_15685 [Rhizobiales bacterium]|nr:hypothetical protein [Hyphomicrobiales bacterium]
MRKEFKQHQWLILVAAVVVLVAAGSMVMGTAGAIEPILVGAILFAMGVGAALLALFHRFTVVVDRKEVAWFFGIGWPRWRMPLADIASVAPVRNQWWWGWGIRITPHGWLFNASGLDAVEITDLKGRKRRLGTDDPKGLAAAIEASRKLAPGRR